MADNNKGLTAKDAAARLGVKRQTLYAYVSRGLISRDVADDGRTSLFDPDDIEQLRLGRRTETDGELHTQIATRLTRVDDHGLWIRGRDLVSLVNGGASFIDVVDLLWDSPHGESWQATTGSASDERAALADLSLIDELRVIVALASSADPLRHDVSPKGVRRAGRSLIVALASGRVEGAPAAGTTIPDQLWARLTDQTPTAEKLGALDAAMALLADHGLASSTFAARIAASVRADLYSVVTTGLGAVGGPLHGAASGAVHELLADAERLGSAAEAAAIVRRRTGSFPGFGHAVYKIQDPRYGELMARLVSAWGDDPRLVNVYRARDVIGERIDAIPNVDMAIGALTYLAEMPIEAGEVIFAIARTAGWLAHAMEEYEEKPLRFRPRAKYAGPSPANRSGQSP